MAQSTVKLIVDAQNAISPLKRVNEQTKALSSSTDKLKNRLNKSNRSFRETGRSAKTASAGVGTLVGALRPLLAALAVVGTARFIFFKTAELETQRKSLEQLTGSLEKTNKIIAELQAFGAVTPFTSSELIEQTKRLKAFGFETEELVDTTKRLSDVAGATGADLTGIATAFGQIRAKGKLQQEENLQLLERGVNITDELKKITKLQGDEFESAMRKGEIGADAVNQALINLTSQGGIFAGGATKQADTLNGKLSTLQDTIDTLARTIGEDLSEEIKGVIDIAISGVKQINKLIERIAVANKVGRLDLANIAMESRKEARELVKEEFGISFVPIFSDAAKREKELFEVIKKRKIEEALTTKEFTKQKDTQDKIKESVIAAKNEAAIINEKTELLNESLGQTNTAVNTINNGSKEITENVKKVKSETDQLKNEFAEIGETIGSQITDALVGAINGTKSLGESARNVLNDLANSILKSGINSLLGGVFGGTKIGGFLGFANGGRPPVGRPSIVGEKGPELFVPRSAGTIIPNNAMGGGVTNMVTINVDATGSAVEGNEEEANEFGNLLAVAIQGELVKQQRPGGILSNTR
ncbi:tape measure protein [uncultured Mediterranean phage uvMED]|nr:tape measure protein [uncultured Mediterranean phage uvMED]BAR22236.1 phage tape measure protein [uncultured Mediterranean phage uvMED]BAR22249.1 phage tape measure protein [uncultured Mediterranean phage uvMED]BAR22321.1 phage tape measure protein [uncultured Mediterranean phage uvMED]BAR22350.1 phage tape measure protein [uncultured Mediterranean phage uvMED]